MRTDGVFTTRLIRLKHWPVNKTLKLIPFGDVHRDSPAHSHDKFEDFCHYARAQKDVLFLGMGDYLDSYSGSERAVIYSGAMHESSRKREESECRGRVSALAKKLEFMRGKLVGILGGNHFPLFADGTTGDQLLAEKLGCSYLGACCAIRLVMEAKGRSARTSLDLFAHHGKGGGTTPGGRFNAVDRMAAVCDADIYLMGDNHARGCFPAGDRLHLVSVRGGVHVKSKSRWLGRTGSFLRGYVEREGNYVTDACLPPANLGWIEFLLTLRRGQASHGDLSYIEINAKQ